MRSILLATDGSPSAEAATREAIDLAEELGRHLVVASVDHMPAYGYYGYGTADLYAELRKSAKEAARKALLKVASQAEAAGVEYEIVQLDGPVVVEICKLAAERRPDLLVIGAHGWGGVKRAVFGSVSLGVLQEAPCPVLVVREHKAAAKARPEVAAT